MAGGMSAEDELGSWPTGRLLSTAARAVEHAWSEALATLGVTHAGLIALHLLRDGPLSQIQLARSAHVETQTMSRTLERLEREGAVTYPTDNADGPSHEIIFYAGFPTTSGRARIVPAAVSPPDELPDADYPMVLSTGRVLEHWHTGSMTRRAGVLDAIEPEAVAFMSPKDLWRRQLSPGDRIRLETRRGAVEVRVRSDRDVPENMVFMPFCYAEAAVNLLTNPALDPFGKIPEFNFCAARVTPLAAMSTAAE